MRVGIAPFVIGKAEVTPKRILSSVISIVKKP